MENRKYEIELEVITPLSVGAGGDKDWIKGIDYIQHKGKVYVLDMRKMMDVGVDINTLSSLFVNSDNEGVIKLLGNNLDKVSKYVFESPANTTNPIKTFLRTQLYDRPVIAGSSIKGSVRSALFNYLRKDEKRNEDVFGSMKEGTDFMRFIQVGDVEMPETILVNSKIFNLRKDENSWTGGWKHSGGNAGETTSAYRPVGFNTLYECVAPGEVGYGTITLASKVFDLVSVSGSFMKYSEKKGELIRDIRGLFHVINNQTRHYLEKEKTFFETFRAERSDELVDCVEYLLDLIPDDDTYCLLKMSAGVGFHSITGDWQYQDYCDEPGVWESGKHNGKKKYKSRKTALYDDTLNLMGFVKLRIMNENESCNSKALMDERHKEILDDILANCNKRDEENRQKEESERLKQEERKAEEEKQERYRLLLEQANALCLEDKWDDAIAKANEAAAIYPNLDEPVRLVENCKTFKARAEFIKEQKEKEQQRFGNPLSEVIAGKTSAGNIIGTTAKWIKENNVSLGDAEYTILLNALNALPAKEKKKVSRKDLLKFMSEEMAERLLGEIVR